MVRRLLAGIFVGIGSLVLISGGVYLVVKGEGEMGFAMIATGTTPLTTMLGFFVGESNGKKLALEET